jgi:hypothetical protein
MSPGVFSQAVYSSVAMGTSANSGILGDILYLRDEESGGRSRGSRIAGGIFKGIGIAGWVIGGLTLAAGVIAYEAMDGWYGEPLYIGLGAGGGLILVSTGLFVIGCVI